MLADLPRGEVVALARAWTSRNATALARLRRVADLSRAVYTIDWAAGLAFQQGSLSPVRVAFELLSAAVDVATIEGRAEDAVVAAALSLDVVLTLDDVPGGYSMRNALAYLACSSLRQSLARGAGPSPELNRRALACVERLERREVLARALRADRAAVFGAIDEIVATGHERTADPTGPALDLGWFYRHTLLARDAAAYGRGIDRLVTAVLDTPEATLIDRTQTIIGESGAGPGREMTRAFLRYWGPSTMRNELELRDVARAIRIAVAASLHRDERGCFPHDVAELVAAGYLAAIPTSPFTGQPIRMARGPDGVAVEVFDAHGPPMFPPLPVLVGAVPPRATPIGQGGLTSVAWATRAP